MRSRACDPRGDSLPALRRHARGRRAALRVVGRAGLRGRARRHPGLGRFRRADLRRVPEAGAGRRHRSHRLDRGAALVQRARRHDRVLVGRVRRAAGRGPSAARARGRGHRQLDGAPLHRRLPLHGRLRQRTRHALVGDHDAGLRRAAARSRSRRRRLARGLDAAPRRRPADDRAVVAAPARGRVLAPRVGRVRLRPGGVRGARRGRLGGSRTATRCSTSWSTSPARASA